MLSQIAFDDGFIFLLTKLVNNFSIVQIFEQKSASFNFSLLKTYTAHTL